MRINIHTFTILALLSALAVTGRFFFQFLPNIQPVTAIVVITGFFLGPYSATLLAVVSTYLSNLLLGMGIWTIWQIIGWGIVGLFSGMLKLRKWKNPLIPVSLYSFFAAYLYGFILDIGTFTYSGSFLPYFLSSLPFNTFHALGNIMFVILLFPIINRILTSERVKARIEK
ncbi:energy-coupling factor transport system substrate-specific component [Gracilibacillus ureilyticus]|uniref:Energy-coupling factor transport system substrate-specific component n=1 Tax=Gracilibacillus ureilyticus TaxID=531814 RepID=A0A1H9LSN5_9BACI|nr:ECF transporter S component [Gracilibacillus ureilyticus]SER14205.1 energy-coupling factor transport system substrate-specific component [Gracilibacillus ureilyticus]